jgi:late competence protein required for DNA uptake (superfamily II DNA/RNA helicase)
MIMKYRDDPPKVVEKMTGQEFVERNPERRMRIRCDLCNAEVKGEDECWLTAGRLYCRACAGVWVVPYVLGLDVVMEEER